MEGKIEIALKMKKLGEPAGKISEYPGLFKKRLQNSLFYVMIP